jgi:hypothetical protein
MTCRVARLSPDYLCRELAYCCECGSANLEACYTSKALGPHLCPICAQSKVECGTWKEARTRSPMKGQHEQQRKQQEDLFEEAERFIHHETPLLK